MEVIKRIYNLGWLIFMFIVVFFGIVQNTQASQIITTASKGYIDLSAEKTDTHFRIPLKGEWIFFPDTLVSPASIDGALLNLPHYFVSVPTKRKEIQDCNYGTYYLKVKTDTILHALSFSSLTVYSSAHFFVDQAMVASIGNPGYSIDSMEPGLVLLSDAFYLGKGEHDFLVHYSNFYREKNGLANDVFLETKKSKVRRSVIQLIKNAIILGTILFIIFNQLTFYLIRRKNIAAFYFGLASVFIFGYIIFMSFYYFGDIAKSFAPPFIVTLKVWRVFYYLTVCFFVLYVGNLFEFIFSKVILKLSVVYCILSALFTLIAPLYWSSINFNYFMIFTLAIALYCVGVGVIGMVRKVEFSTLFVFGFAFFSATVINDILHNLLILSSVNLLDVGIFGMMLTQAQIINLKLHRYLNQSEDLSKHLKYVNQNLETLVLERTEEIEEQKAEIEAQRDEIIEQRDYAMDQHKIISSQKKTITDSINYAKEIQYAVLPDEEFLNKYFRESFILFKPKDNVSGDFYWMREFEIDGKTHFAFCIADCTGHGVPGALLSMLGMSLLSEIILHEDIRSAAQILEELRYRFKDILEDHLNKQASSDGMHITACIIDENGLLDCAGAYQSFYHFRGNKVSRIKGTTSIIGVYLREVPFVSMKIQLKKGDRLYFFTDGYGDQMSGKGKGRFMLRNMLKLFRSLNDVPLVVQRDRVDDAFEDWRGDFEQIDDVLVVGVKY